jgi:hypothetical protein
MPENNYNSNQNVWSNCLTWTALYTIICIWFLAQAYFRRDLSFVRIFPGACMIEGALINMGYIKKPIV